MRLLILWFNLVLRPHCSYASGTPLSVLDPAGYPTVEATYKRMESNLQVRCGFGVDSTEGFDDITLPWMNA